MTFGFRQRAESDTADEESGDYWARLLHRWFFQYNPLYLFSAASVLAGVVLMSGALVGTQYALLGVDAIAEVYAFALIGSAALLARCGQKRPAVMLALITALYQGDVTLHTETCAYLGWPGVGASISWVLLFGVKLRGLAWALGLRLSRSAWFTPLLGAVGLAAMPWWLASRDARTATPVVALWLFSVFAAGLWSQRHVASLKNLNEWGRTVLVRSARAVWLLWIVLLGFHLDFWADEYALKRGLLLPILPLLATRWVQHEGTVWRVVGVTLLAVGLMQPGLFWTTAVIAAATLTLNALRSPDRNFQPAPRTTRLRLLTGAGCCAYLALWTLDWTQGAWPTHVLGLDLGLATALGVLVWRTRMGPLLFPLAATCLHHGVQVGFIHAPRSYLGWGITAVVTGFSLLAVALATSLRIRDTSPSSRT